MPTKNAWLLVSPNAPDKLLAAQFRICNYSFYIAGIHGVESSTERSTFGGLVGYRCLHGAGSVSMVATGRLYALMDMLHYHAVKQRPKKSDGKGQPCLMTAMVVLELPLSLVTRSPFVGVVQPANVHLPAPCSCKKKSSRCCREAVLKVFPRFTRHLCNRTCLVGFAGFGVCSQPLFLLVVYRGF